MFGLFKSRKKQQEKEEARRREEAEAAERAAASAGESTPDEDAADATAQPGANEQAAVEHDANERDAVVAETGEPDTSAAVEEIDPAKASVDAFDPERSAAVDYTPEAIEQTAAEQALSEPLPPESAASAVDETPAGQTRASELATDVTPPPEETGAAARAPEDAATRDVPPVPAEPVDRGESETRIEPGPETKLEPALEPEPDVRTDAPAPVDTPPAEVAPTPPATQEKPKKGGWMARVKAGLGRTRANLTDGIAELLLGKKQIDDDMIEELETQLLMADVGIEATTEIIGRLTDRVSRKELADADALYRALQEELAALLEPVTQPLTLPPKGEGPFVILMVGVNGVGKTTTIGKLTQRFQNEGRSVMLAAGDTFRAAAVEQLKVWGERNHVPVIAQHTGADSASVIYDALAAARARNVDVLIADTAGRLHNKSHLMEELKKVQRVMAKLDAAAPHEVMLVLDAGTGQNAISQATTFDEAIPVTGITLTKLDGTAKGGIIFALAKKMNIPIRFIGVGETLDDLRPFDSDTFVRALFSRDDDAES
ncbi:signal recognition particle-docking protein FtsY [Salinicola halophilus]|uniref:signal recognition particle-docking protein FtsY n=1 Tax=Salinicola halophilus TaxID=184065 RepID=UPI000DA1C08C|nr:signal recognition particle-docking protein FtsY [Salinicola halophilus]